MVTHEAFEALVAESEREASAHPRRYRLKLVALGLLGYAYIAVVMAVLLGLTALLVRLFVFFGLSGVYIFLQLGLALIALEYVVIRAVWVRTSAPEGVPVAWSEVPELVREIRAIRGRPATRRLHRLVLTADVNAGVAQQPRLGIFGWHRNYLILGAPLLHTLDEDEFRAVLAHELGHLSGAHGRTGAWLYRIRNRWKRLYENLNEKQALVFRAFMDWYAPLFLARSYVLARAHEYEADRYAERVVGASTTARTLVRSELAERRWSRVYGKAVQKRARGRDSPPGDMVSAGCRMMREADRSPESWLLEALHAPTRSVDAHPALTQRLQALGYDSEEAIRELLAEPRSSRLAWDAYFDGKDALLDSLDRVWQEQSQDGWDELQDHWYRLEERLTELDKEAAARPLTADEVVERASALTALGEPEEAVPMLTDLLAREPGHAGGNLLLGQLLLEQGEEAGLERLETAMAAEPMLTYAGCTAALKYVRDEGRAREADQYEERLGEHVRKLLEDFVERSLESVGPDDVLLPHELDPDAVEGLLKYIRPRDQVAAAYLARKRVEVFPHRPLYLLGIEVDWSECLRPPEQAAPKLMESLSGALIFPGETLILLLNGPRERWLLEAFEGVPDSRIFRRDNASLSD